MHHVLMIAYYYPPVHHSGTRRIEKFVKYLPAYGYQPVLLTTKGRGSLPNDAATLTFRIDDITGILKRAYRAYALRHVHQNQRANVPAFSQDNLLERWRTAACIPDHQIMWFPNAVWKGLRILRSHPIRVLYSTSPPETDHVIALTLKRKTGLPWVADFRDGWMFEPQIPCRHTSMLRQRIESAMEHAVLLHADYVVVVNDSMADDFRARYPEVATKVVVIQNGYDADDFSSLCRQVHPYDHLRLVYTGSLSFSREGTSIDGFLRALKYMHDEDLALMKHIQIVLMGHLSAHEVRVIQQSGMSAIFSIPGPVSYQQALQQQMNADVLLLVIAPDTVGVSTNKVYEYLATGRPILALSGQSDAAKLVADCGAGLVVEPDNVIGIQRALQTYYEQWKAGLLPTRVHEKVRQFDRRELTKKLAGLFDTL